MSRIGKKPIEIPSGVTVNVTDNNGVLSVVTKGPKGELKRDFNFGVKFNIEEKMITVQAEVENSVQWGLARALLNNMIEGVSKGFEKVLEFSGVGFKAQAKKTGNNAELEMSLGFSHPVFVKAPEGIDFVVEKNTIKVIGIDKEIVGHVAAQIRAKRPPEPYKGTGIKYKDEVIIRKAGKKAVAGA